MEIRLNPAPPHRRICDLKEGDIFSVPSEDDIPLILVDGAEIKHVGKNTYACVCLTDGMIYRYDAKEPVVLLGTIELER